VAKKILAFGASNSSKSINKQLATYAAHQINNAEVQILDLNDFEMPIYAIDKERASGIPALAVEFKEAVKNADGIVISLAEHNGAYSTAFKNIFDWISRMDGSVWDDKPLLLLATSPGKRGGKTVLEIATNRFKFMSKGPIFPFSLPSFGENFSKEKGILTEELATVLRTQIAAFEDALD
jgi:NAD(P)H-dependent FMN reductase